MGYSRAQITTSAVNNRVATSYPIETGKIVSMSARATEIAILPSRVYARIGLSVDGDTNANIITTLAEGYVGSGVSLLWSGAIKTVPGMRAIIETWGRIATTIVLEAITESV